MSALSALALFSPLVLAVAVCPQGPSGKDGKPEKKELPWRVHGQVVDELGKPIAGAGLVMGSIEVLCSGEALASPLARSDAVGRLQFTIPPAEADQKRSRYLLLTAPGRASMRLTMRPKKPAGQGESYEEVTLGRIILPRGATIHGRVRKAGGRPLAGARVVANDVFKATHLQVKRHTSSNIFVCYDTSDDKGAFTLHGVLARGASLSITAEGYHKYDEPHINTYQPQVIELKEGGFVEGQVLDANGKPAAARVYVYYEMNESRKSIVVGEDGKFKINLDHPRRYCLAVYPSNASGRVQWTYSKVMRGPKTGVEVKLPTAARVTGGVVVHVTEAASGKAIEGFKAAAVWMDENSFRYNPGYLESRFRSAALKAETPGTIRLPGPSQGQPETGRILVKAEGFAPFVIDEVTWTDEETPKYEAKLVPESSIVGVVIDKETEEPMAGVTVYASKVQKAEEGLPIRSSSSRNIREGSVKTDEKGHFRLLRLAKGKYQVHASLPGRPEAKFQSINLKEAEIRGQVQLQLPRGATLTGTLVGAKLGPLWKVKLEGGNTSTNPNALVQVLISSASGSRTRPGQEAELDKDGKFSFKGLSPGNYTLRLLIPERDGTGGYLEIPVEPLRIRKRDMKREFDISEDLPGQIKGKVKLTGSHLPPGRLMVIAQRFDQSTFRRYSSSPDLNGQHALVGRDGSFDLLVQKGQYAIKLVDLSTGVSFYQSEEKVKVSAGKERQEDIEAAIAMVRVKLVSMDEGSEIVASRLELQVQHPATDPRMPQFIFGNQNYDRGIGVPLRLGEVEKTIYLPKVETRILVRTSAHQLSQAMHRHNTQPIGEFEFTPELGKTNKIEIEVEAPMEVAEEELQVEGKKK